MPQVRQMAQTDNTVDEKTSIQRHQTSGTVAAHVGDEVDHELAEELEFDRNIAVDPGDSQPLHSTASVRRGLNWKGGDPTRPGKSHG